MELLPFIRVRLHQTIYSMTRTTNDRRRTWLSTRWSLLHRVSLVPILHIDVDYVRLTLLVSFYAPVSTSPSVFGSYTLYDVRLRPMDVMNCRCTCCNPVSPRHTYTPTLNGLYIIYSIKDDWFKILILIFVFSFLSDFLFSLTWVHIFSSFWILSVRLSVVQWGRNRREVVYCASKPFPYLIPIIYF